ncbi:permease [Pseudoalteromonas luteoviolacea]|uniref:permease n=1 Tax=Pseudoalteromonas luteoviolacea TaxID=43657 RepID=UPI0007B08165|nr:permease [Pseudoalteromonas luteoviolacea]KZN53779.1 membrane protein [Pseudoalteromonas luteoviolacea CPMOR-2]TQF67762.1 permease [Pseudoalteromonas luteoviolacea]
MSLNQEMIVSTINMFAFLAVELTLLFLLISYIVGVLQEYIPPTKIQSILSSKKGKGYFVAGFLGAITPFCSCSTIPFLKGLLRAKAGFGTMMVFLFASPLLNPIIIGLFAITFGVKVTLFYFAIAMGVSIIAGITLEKLGFEKYVKPEAYVEPEKKACGATCGGNTQPDNKWFKIWKSTWKDFKKVLPYLFGGIALGSLIYGFMPAEFVASVANESNPFAIPFAAVIGIPLYIRAEAVIPLSAALAEKGMGLGAVMALIIGSAGASLTEVILLKSIFKNKMIWAFLFVILSMAISAGFLYQYLF